MKLLAKFNLILGPILGLGLLYTAIVVDRNLKDIVVKQYHDQADLMLDTALAIREYTSSEIKPLVGYDKLPDRTASQGGSPEVNSPKFLAQSVPAYAANTTFKYLRELRNREQSGHARNMDFYRESSDNPTNKNDLCGPHELELLHAFRRDPELTQVYREHTAVDGTSYMELAKPMVCDKSCLPCHSSPDTNVAKTMLASNPDVYRKDQGFGWKVGDTIATRVVRVPTSQIKEQHAAMFYTLIKNLILVTVATFVSLNVALIWFITRPVSRLSAWAEEVSTGDLDRGRLPVKGKDEIAMMTESFNRMYISLLSAMNMLKNKRR